jgi:hypothetical protein
MKKIWLFSWFIVLLLGCEKDDICTEPNTTPRLIIDFYDSQNTSVLKQVANLVVQGNGANTTLTFNLVTRIELPLKTNENVTEYSLNINANSTTQSNIDLLRFNYTRNDLYISRGCGFKTNFDLNLFEPIVPSNPQGDDEFWIENIELIKNIL